MTKAGYSAPTDRSRTLEELHELVRCPECDEELRLTWWPLPWESVEVLRVCDECAQYYCVRLTGYIEEPPMTHE